MTRQAPAFRSDNTEGYSQDDLDVLSEAHEILMDGSDESDDFAYEQDWGNYSDALHNAWFEGATVDQLLAAVRKK